MQATVFVQLNQFVVNIEDTSQRHNKTLLKFYRKIASRPWLTFLIPFLMVLVGRAIYLPLVPPPQPSIEDEFSYLLAADTFSSFRVTNPQHPLWEHFETVHEFVHPTYMSKYPPMQGLALAFGKIVFGSYWMGVLLPMAIFCGLLPWVFRAWLPATWSLTGALLATYKVGVMSYWTETYFGGGVAALGGALVFGALRRLALEPSPKLAAIFTLGACILANSRPFEGCIFVIICLVYLLSKWFGDGRWRKTWDRFLQRCLPAASLVAIPVILAMAYYNFRVTGSATTMPYQIYERQYSMWTPFYWQTQPTPAPVYHHDFIRGTWQTLDGSRRIYEHQHWKLVHLQNFIGVTLLYFGPGFYFGGFMLVFALLVGEKNRTMLVMLTVYYVCTRITTYILPHYTAPAAALIYLAMTSSLHTTWLFASRGFLMPRAFALWVIISFLAVTTLFRTAYGNIYLWYKPDIVKEREEVLNILNNEPGPQLVFVHYGAYEHLNGIWTYNEANIDASKIIWVDSMSPEENQKVLDYYKSQHRKIWWLDEDEETTLRPLDDPSSKPLIKMKNNPIVTDPPE
jgi:hypothetical protein